MSYLSKKKIGHWHDLSKNKLLKLRNKEITKFDKNIFFKNLCIIGYFNKYSNYNIRYSKILTFAFQRRFRQELVNGIIDRECLIISKNLIKKFK